MPRCRISPRTKRQDENVAGPDGDPDLPFLGVYIADETMTPDGDGNAGAIGFIHTVRYGVSVIEAGSDQDVLEAKIDAAWWAIMNGVWADQYVMNRSTRGTRIPRRETPTTSASRASSAGHESTFRQAGVNNETPIGELQYDISCRYRSYFAPVITDDC